MEERGVMMSMSRTGLAGRPGMEVLPTCSIEVIGIPFRVFSSEVLISWNLAAHAGLWGSSVTFIAGTI